MGPAFASGGTNDKGPGGGATWPGESRDDDGAELPTDPIKALNACASADVWEGREGFSVVGTDVGCRLGLAGGAEWSSPRSGVGVGGTGAGDTNGVVSRASGEVTTGGVDMDAEWAW